MIRTASRTPFLLALLLIAAVLLPVRPASATFHPQRLTPHGETIKENAGRARVKFTVHGKVKRTVKVPFQTVAGSAKPGKDYRTTKGKLTLKKGSYGGSIWIPLVNDKVTEPTESFAVKFKDGDLYDLAEKKVTVTIKDDDKVVVKRWAGNITVHVTQHQVMNPTTIDEDWTFVAHLVLAPDQYRTSWFPTSASSWSLDGTHTVTGANADCLDHPDHEDFHTTGRFMTNPLSGYPGVGQAQWWLKTQAGSVPNVMEAGPISADATSYTYWDYTHTCTEHVGASDITVGFQTHWRTSDPVGHPGTFPFTFHGGADPRLTVDFTDNYSQQAGWTTHSVVTGTLHGTD